MRKYRKSVRLAALSVLLSVFAHSAEADTLSKIKEQGFAQVGFSNLTPWGFVAENGELDGVEAVLIRAFLASQGVEGMDGVLTQYVSLIPALQAGRFDLIGAGMQIRPERCKQVTFGDPEWISQQAFATLSGNPKGLHSLEDITRKKGRLAVVSGGAEREYAVLNGVPEEQIVVFPDLATVAAGLRAERIDAVMFAAVSIRGFVKTQSQGDIEMVTLTKQPVGKDGKPAIGYGAIGFRKGDDALIAAWNDWLRKAKQSGELLRLVEPYGLEATDIPAEDITAESLCASK
ncbi:ectoine/hydroxyectoine ABC transporter substrate-binding protein EhuB [Bacillus subtilis]|uniref:ectoine/hydroxyectoine ABC transporter substrate-binding protein EhuB n=1 Tax=Pseudochrobactrum asaccharolyticum TaxID=354351 RepID=UPI001EFFCF54|nr:ectoine/hydroxyectoine ABC transporter substrate-binding protein EhuB [Pseudochrobactrum asaccharolyticum]MCF7646568.1 ectoine/hydroxyectoine ABC transporter substrate-binding protein EhuB [Pseudochrobactrum asaccharolyticum]MCF7672707.1 ectoine/hydroxyectoine ABC transporter substrate-binding protein EhuB [Bacillus subtilis]